MSGQTPLAQQKRAQTGNKLATKRFGGIQQNPRIT
jgi:hypothetical protein